MISEERLKKQRRIALLTIDLGWTKGSKTLANFILELTQELLDQGLRK